MLNETDVGLLTLLSGIIAFIVGLRQYRVAMHWKQAEWIAEQMKIFFDDPLVQNALLMIDWNERKIFFDDPLLKSIDAKDDLICNALRTHSDQPYFSDEESRIRDCFDRLLDGIERFSANIEVGLFEPSDVAPYLRYWATRLDNCGAKKKAIEGYMIYYNFNGAERLLEKLRTHANK
ncbi:MAG: hypothetical protein KIS92_23215 [Planctomycetota bacterium]|nr:hypothetical protein [Planctomycetota bacterium]